MQLIQPLLGDLIFDGVGLAGGAFVLVLMWEAWKDWKRARDMRKRRRSRLPCSTRRRRPAGSVFRIFRGKLVLLVVASGAVLMLVGGRQNPRGGQTAPTTRAGTLKSAADNLSRAEDSSRLDGAILTFQSLPPPGGRGGSIANGNSNVVAAPFGSSPGANPRTLNHP